ncbi:Unknown protein [Striga hermonthica]|uniref:Uncharacterized protein n=1 Tax=Striga hermonthica TaxID=68872 RepID=A0A9N7NU44_STRHE|nr:Unknown protein [Striga hermonthica]
MVFCPRFLAVVSKTHLALLLPILAVLFATFSFPIMSISLLFILLLSVAPFLFISSKRAPAENDSENTLTAAASLDDDTKAQEKSTGDENDKFSEQLERLDCSEEDQGSISDEEGLIEIAIPSGHSVLPEKDMFLDDDLSSSRCCKLMNEEDNLIEIDIYMGSIKCCSKFVDI